MDNIVKEAMIKWPNVPDCYGWLGLDARGSWYLRDAACQRSGPFAGEGASLVSRGSLVEHAKLREFIGRNYAHDQRGCWYFQNGPQRVYVELERAPWIWRLMPDGLVKTHTGMPVQLTALWLEDDGSLWGQAEVGVGLVHTQDMLLASDFIEQGRWPMPLEHKPTDFNQFVLSPHQLAG